MKTIIQKYQDWLTLRRFKRKLKKEWRKGTKKFRAWCKENDIITISIDRKSSVGVLMDDVRRISHELKKRNK